MKQMITQPCTLLDCLIQMFPNSSKSNLRKMLTQGRITVDGQTEHRAKTQLEAGTTVMILDRPTALVQTPPPVKPNPVDLDVIFEDETLLVVNKPAHLLSVATDRLEMDTLHSRCVDYLRFTESKAWCYIVHRLDKETSGAMVLAKTKPAKEDLQSQFADREVHRIYLALVEGAPSTDSGTVHSYLTEDKFLNVKAVNSKHPKGKEAISHYRVLDTIDELSLVEVTIETGRRHQIRMAMQYLKSPVVGDELHGAMSNPHKRVMLHASALEFIHPSSDDPVRFEAPPPSMFRLI